MSQTNPFFHRGPIRDSRYFAGRKQEVQVICNLVAQNQSVALYGQRRFGKTSILFHIAQTELATQYGVSENSRWAYIDGGMLDGLTEEWFYGAILRELDKDVEQTPYTTFVSVLRELTNTSQIIIALDEFELIAVNPNFGTTLFNRLRGLTTQLPVSFITVSKEPLARLSFTHPDTLSSPFFNIFASQRITAFAQDEAVDLLVTLSEQAGNPFSDETVEFILEMVGYHPLFLQIAGFHCFSLVIDGDLTSGDREEVRQRIYAGLVGHIQYYWNNLSSEQQRSLAVADIKSANGELDNVRESGLVYDTGKICEVVSTFIAEQKISGLVRQGPVVLDMQRGRARVNFLSVHLTQTEFTLLRLLVENHGRILSPEEIEAALWPDEIAVDPERVRGIIKRLRATLGDDGDMIVNRRGQGYFLDID